MDVAWIEQGVTGLPERSLWAPRVTPLGCLKATALLFESVAIRASVITVLS